MNIRKNLHAFFEEGDLYLTLLVAALLAVVHYFHLIVGDKDVPAAVLGVLALVTINSLRNRRKIQGLRIQIDALRKAPENAVQLVSETAEEPGVHWYLRRSDAEQDMHDDLCRHHRIVFIGVSQRSLADYLRTALAHHGHAALSWQSIEVYFAAPEIGSLYEGSDFRFNVRKSRQAIAACLTDPNYGPTLPVFRGVKFFQSRLPADHGGSMFSSDPTDPTGATGEFQVIYIVHSKLHATELKDGITTRFEAVPRRSSGKVSIVHSARIMHYTEAYRNLHSQSLSLGRFQKSIWDDSAEKWSQFSTRSGVLATSMSYLVSLSDIGPDETILELGAGSGETSKTLVQSVQSGTVTLLDASPQMIALARRNFEGNRQVDVALCAIPEFRTDHIDLGDRKFTLIIIHQSFQDLATAFGNNLEVFAKWCFDKLTPGGRLSIAVHNAIVETERPPGYENWEDTFRRALYEEVRRVRGSRALSLPRHHAQYQAEQIERAFSSQGFLMKQKERRLIPMSMDERILMWRVPAIMNSVVDVQVGGMEHIDILCDKLQRRFAGLRTMPRTTTYWIFRRD